MAHSQQQTQREVLILLNMSCPNALDSIEKVLDTLQGKRVVVFLDYDGTLSPIVTNPDDAHISTEMRETVRELAAATTTAIVSGRSREKVHAFVQIDDILYAGSHGFEIGWPGERLFAGGQAADMLPVLQEFAGLVGKGLAHVEGVLVEDNKYSVTVHYRMVGDEARVPEVFAYVVKLVRDSFPTLVVRHGKKVLEVRPKVRQGG